MKRPILIIMAAGMGSRYGGLKQMDPIDADGHLIIDYAIHDAIEAGFEEVIFVIKRENEADFRERIGIRAERHMKVHYVHQELTNLPEGYAVPEGRVKPWGTGHAVLSCIDAVGAHPFAVINADDFYGREAFALIYAHLSDEKYSGSDHHAMVGYELTKTLTENGSVARGVCEVDPDGLLTGITERTRIEKQGEGGAYTEDDGATWIPLPEDAVVSMNMWGFSPRMMDALRAGFPAFLDEGLARDPMKCEYFLPFVVEDLLRGGQADVRVLRTHDQWYGVTYAEDKPQVVAALESMRASGRYPARLHLDE